MLSTRPSDDTLFMRVARMMATRSLCDRDQVGAVIVDTNLRITATGRNGPPAGFDHQERTCLEWCVRAATLDWEANSHGEDLPAFCRPLRRADGEYSTCPTIHAEANALLSSDRSRHESGTMYLTGPPCWSCGKMIANSGLATLIVEFDPLKFAERSANDTYLFMESVGINVIVIETKGQDDV